MQKHEHSKNKPKYEKGKAKHTLIACDGWFYELKEHKWSQVSK